MTPGGGGAIQHLPAFAAIVVKFWEHVDHKKKTFGWLKNQKCQKRGKLVQYKQHKELYFSSKKILVGSQRAKKKKRKKANFVKIENPQNPQKLFVPHQIVKKSNEQKNAQNIDKIQRKSTEIKGRCGEEGAACQKKTWRL